MKEPTQSYDLSPLAADYDIVGEQDNIARRAPLRRHAPGRDVQAT